MIEYNMIQIIEIIITFTKIVISVMGSMANTFCFPITIKYQ
jgi:hypothetical protein